MRRILTYFGFILLLLIVCSGCQMPFNKPLDTNPTPQIQEPIPGPTNRNPENSAVQPGKFYRMGNPQNRTVALSFDDGPEPNWTPQILDILRDKQVKATFFVIGKEMDKYPDIAQRIVDEGHIVGNHTYHHINLNNVPPEKMIQEIDEGAAAIAKYTERKPKLLRPPFGAQNPKVIEVANNKNNFVILWSIDTEDWRGLDANTIRARVIPIIGNGSIVLQHNGEGPNLQGTVQALPLIIDEIRARGFTIVTIPELLNIPAYE